jgi:hypothetical protein
MNFYFLLSVCFFTLFLFVCFYNKNLKELFQSQIISEIPLTKNCLLSKYYSIQNTPKKNIKEINLHVPGYYPRETSRCDNLSVNKCLLTHGCGWLSEPGNKDLSFYGRCYPGTPIGPLNPKLYPNVEDSEKRNLIDQWKYANPNPFVSL